MEDVFDNWIPLGCYDYQLNSFCLLLFYRGLWMVRNKMGIEKVFLRSSNEVFHIIFVFLQKWHILLKEQAARYLDNKLTRMKKWLQNFWKNTKDMEIEEVL